MVSLALALIHNKLNQILKKWYIAANKLTYIAAAFMNKNNKQQKCQWGYHRVWIVRLPIALVDFSRVDLLFVVRYF
jgi:hypothetical protein